MRQDPNLYEYWPYKGRPKIEWPNGARLAFWVAPNIEFYELNPPDNPHRKPWPHPYPPVAGYSICLLYTSPSPRDRQKSRMPSSA